MDTSPTNLSTILSYLSPINTSSYSMVEERDEKQSYVVELIPQPNPSESNCGACWSYRGKGASIVKECIGTKADGCNIFHLFSNENLISIPHVCCINLTYMLLDSLVTNMDV